MVAVNSSFQYSSTIIQNMTEITEPRIVMFLLSLLILFNLPFKRSNCACSVTSENPDTILTCYKIKFVQQSYLGNGMGVESPY